VRPLGVDRCDAEPAHPFERGSGLAVDELGAELDRNRKARLVVGPDASAYPVSCLEDEDRALGCHELGRRGEARGARADYDDVVGLGSHAGSTWKAISGVQRSFAGARRGGKSARAPS
jgi:hypothetical protein